jgi:hypothetical protein
VASEQHLAVLLLVLVDALLDLGACTLLLATGERGREERGRTEVGDESLDGPCGSLREEVRQCGFRDDEEGKVLTSPRAQIV